MIRYTLLRLLVFFGILIALWLLGLRQNVPLLLLIAALLSTMVAFFGLRRPREAAEQAITDRLARRREAARQGADEEAEDNELDNREEEQA